MPRPLGFAAARQETQEFVPVEATEPFAHRVGRDAEEAGRRLDAPPAGRLHHPQPHVPGVFTLTHQGVISVGTHPTNQPVFAHCKWETDRVGMMVAIYRMVVEGWSKRETVDEMRKMGFNNTWEDIGTYLEGVDATVLRYRLQKCDSTEVTVVP